jgi:uncharacterized protein (TIGR03086 family)
MSDRIDLLDSAVDTMADLMEGVAPAEFGLPTPCTHYTVGDLLDHVVGWAYVFGAATTETDASRDPDTYRVEKDHAGAFRRAGHAAAAGLRQKGLDRTVVMTSNPIPASMVLDMMIMEYPGHGWDLSRATGQDYPFDAEVVTDALEAAERMIQPQYRGQEEGQFRPIVPTADGASVVDRYVAFLGRDPAWRPGLETQP